jgi:hypothetical protein
MIKLFLPLSLLGAILLAGCGSTQNVVVGSADEILPAQTASDWRTYADHLVVAKVTAEEKTPLSKEDTAAGEGFIDRILTFKIEDVLWSRGNAPDSPSELKISIDGWTVHDNKETPMRFEGEPQILVDHTYVLPITYLAQGRLVESPAWINLSVTAIIPADNGELGQGDSIVGKPSEVVSSLWGQPVSAAATLLETTPLPEEAAPYMDLPPTDRLTAITKSQMKTLPEKD